MKINRIGELERERKVLTAKLSATLSWIGYNCGSVFSDDLAKKQEYRDMLNQKFELEYNITILNRKIKNLLSDKNEWGLCVETLTVPNYSKL